MVGSEIFRQYCEVFADMKVLQSKGEVANCPRPQVGQARLHALGNEVKAVIVFILFAAIMREQSSWLFAELAV